MVFSSTIFLFIFLPTCLFFYFIVNNKLKNLVLLLFSLIFYAWGEPKNIAVMILSIILNYFFGLLVASENNFKRKFFLILACIYNLGVLFIFKYLRHNKRVLYSTLLSLILVGWNTVNWDTIRATSEL